MAIPKKLETYLRRAGISFKSIRHRTVYTAYDLASTLGAKTSEVAKTLHIEAALPKDKKTKHLLVVLPASRYLDLAKLKKILRAKKVAVAKEGAMKKIFNLRSGTLVPFGAKRPEVNVFIDRALARAKRCIIAAGTFEDAIEMKIKDFLKATNGTLAQFSKKNK